MSKARALVLGLVGVVSMLVPAIALACPAARASCCGSSLGEYASQFGLGLLAGVGSVAVESALRKRKRSS
jgi:hypothetical protein